MRLMNIVTKSKYVDLILIAVRICELISKSVARTKAVRTVHLRNFVDFQFAFNYKILLMLIAFSINILVIKPYIHHTSI